MRLIKGVSALLNSQFDLLIGAWLTLMSGMKFSVASDGREAPGGVAIPNNVWEWRPQSWALILSTPLAFHFCF